MNPVILKGYMIRSIGIGACRAKSLEHNILLVVAIGWDWNTLADRFGYKTESDPSKGDIIENAVHRAAKIEIYAFEDGIGASMLQFGNL